MQRIVFIPPTFQRFIYLKVQFLLCEISELEKLRYLIFVWMWSEMSVSQSDIIQIIIFLLTP